MTLETAVIPDQRTGSESFGDESTYDGNPANRLRKVFLSGVILIGVSHCPPGSRFLEALLKDAAVPAFHFDHSKNPGKI